MTDKRIESDAVDTEKECAYCGMSPSTERDKIEPIWIGQSYSPEIYAEAKSRMPNLFTQQPEETFGSFRRAMLAWVLTYFFPIYRALEIAEKQAPHDAVDTEKQELIEALRFYADEYNYLGQDNSCADPSCCTPWEYVPVMEDSGRRAREVLAKHGGE